MVHWRNPRLPAGVQERGDESIQCWEGLPLLLPKRWVTLMAPSSICSCVNSMMMNKSAMLMVSPATKGEETSQ